VGSSEPSVFEGEAATLFTAVIDKATTGTGTGVTTSFADGATLPIGTGNGNISVTNNGNAVITTKFYRNNSTTFSILNNSAGEIRLYPYNTNGGELRYEISSGFNFKSITTQFSSTSGAVSINSGSSTTDRTVTVNFSGTMNLISLKNSANSTSANNLQIISVSLTYESSNEVEAEFFSTSLLNATENKANCTTDAGWSSLQSDYNALSADAKTEFKTNTTNQTIVDARERYNYLIAFNNTLTDFVNAV
jgi:hypothetical protein